MSGLIWLASMEGTGFMVSTRREYKRVPLKIGFLQVAASSIIRRLWTLVYNWWMLAGIHMPVLRTTSWFFLTRPTFWVILLVIVPALALKLSLLSLATAILLAGLFQANLNWPSINNTDFMWLTVYISFVPKFLNRISMRSGWREILNIWIGLLLL